MSENAEAVKVLTRLLEALKDSDSLVNKDSTKSTSPVISFWRHLPENVQTAYKMMEDGANLIKATSTKYTLVGNISLEDGSKLTQELRQGAEVVASAVLVLHTQEVGCGISCRKYAKRVAVSLLSSVRSLIQYFVDMSASSEKEEKDKNVGAQKTGVVWSCCDEILMKKIPKGNRAAMRRDLFTWMKECNETIEEFQEIVDKGPKEESVEEEQTSNKSDGDPDDFDFFLDDSDDQYSTHEFKTAKPTLGIIKASLGTFKCVLKFCESVGDYAANSDISPSEKQKLYDCISRVHELTKGVGNGVTDLGCLLYPPMNTVIESGELRDCLIQQVTGLREVHENIREISKISEEEAGGVDLPTEVTDLSSKLTEIIDSRFEETQKQFS